MFSPNRITAGLAAVTVALGLGACDDSSPSSPSNSTPSTSETQFANNSQQTGLVNVSLGDVAVLNDVNLAVAANVVATVCDATVGVAVLAQQVIGDGGQTFCEGTAREVTITQATPGANAAPDGGNNSRQEGLVNVSVGDVDILNNVNLAVAANVVATVCDVTVGVAALAEQLIGDGSTTQCTSTTNPVEIVQS
jgi:hypothetical protein